MSARRQQKQFRYVFATEPTEASLYHVVQPELCQLSEETIDPKTLALRVDHVANLRGGDQMPAHVPRVTVTVDQRTGQVNVLVSPLVDEYLPRTPALTRMQSQELRAQEAAGSPYSASPHQISITSPIDTRLLPEGVRPPLNSREIAQSPAGVAIRTPGGTHYLPAGSIKTPNGDIYTPKGVSYSPGGTCYWPKGTEFDEEGYARTPAGTTYTPGGTGYGVSGHVYTPHGTAYSPSGVAYTGWKGTYQWKPEYPPSPRGRISDEELSQPSMYPEQLTGVSPASMGYGPSPGAMPTRTLTLQSSRDQSAGVADEFERQRLEYERRDSLQETRRREEQRRLQAEIELEQARLRGLQSRRAIEERQQQQQMPFPDDRFADAKKLTAAREEALEIERRSQQSRPVDKARGVREMARRFEREAPPEFDVDEERERILASTNDNTPVARPVIPGENTALSARRSG